MVSVVGRAMSRTLHRVGECYRKPGVHYRVYELFGGDLPTPEMYHRACRICFPRSAGEVGPREQEGSSLDSAVASSTSSSSSME